MKKHILHIIAAIPLLLFCSFQGWSVDYYVSPTGNDSNPGTLSRPWLSFQHALTLTNPGDIVFFRGGTYTMTSSSGIDFSGSKSGTETNPISYYNYPGETPIFDFNYSAPNIMNPVGMSITGVSYINLRGFEIRNVNATAAGGIAYGIYVKGNNINFERIGIYVVFGIGYYLEGNNLFFNNCDAFWCQDIDSENPGSRGNGWQIVSNGNDYLTAFTGCRAAFCFNNGWDCNLNDGVVTWDHCWAVSNGQDLDGTPFSLSSEGNGFSLGHNTVAASGKTQRHLRNCIAAGNYGIGFTEDNLGYPQIKMEIYNCVSYNNAYGFANYLTSTGLQQANYRNNVAYNNRTANTQWNDASKLIHDHNSWNIGAPNVTDADFISLETRQLCLIGTRKPDGSLPDVTFMNLASGSDLIDAGVNVGLPYSGSAPDLGWIEYSGTVPVIPVYLGSEIKNATPSRLDIIFDLNLANIIPATSAFTVRVNSVNRSVNSVAISDNIVQLSLASPVVFGDVVTVSYTKPGTNPLQTPAGGEAASLVNQSVTNNVVQVQVPTVITTAISDIRAAWARSGGNVTSDGGAAVTETGICWNTSGSPTTANSRMQAYPYGTLSYISVMTILNPNTTYYVRAYATNSIGTAYGNQEIFTTPAQFDPITFNPGLTYGQVADIEGNIYKTIQIGTKEWMAENLKTTKYNDNTAIPLITSNSVWGSLTTPGYCWANNDETLYKNIYGALYNWYTVNTGKLCPTGWHVSTDAEWTTLVDYLGGKYVAANMLKEPGTNHWTSLSTDATNTSGFTALGGGIRYYSGGTFYDVGNNGSWWGSTAEIMGMTSNSAYVNRGIGPFYTYGLSVRCVKGAVAVVPTLTTKPATLITYRSANTGGDITNNGGAPVTERGVCWSTTTNPTILNNHQASGDLTDSFIDYLDNLGVNTTYYVRAYAINSAGTSYGNEITFTSYKSDAVTDVDGNFYNLVTIGSQVWMAENLKTSRYNDGTEIPLVTDNNAWTSLTTPGYCWYNNDQATFGNTYGALYNWYVVDAASNGGKNVCPTGWHVANDAEWSTLASFVDPTLAVSGGMLKEAGTTHWDSPNSGATNGSSFTALPGGFRDNNGQFSNNGIIGNIGNWWTSTEFSSGSAYMRGMYSMNPYVGTAGLLTVFGNSVRCLKNAVAVVPTLTTKPASIITYRSANSGGDIINNGGAPVTERGVCWNTSGNPTISNNHQASGDLTDSFINYLDNLAQNTTYYVRAYATNSAGTGYGNEINFKTTCEGTVFKVGHTDVTCFGGSDGDIGVGVLTGGTPPWTLVWTGPDSYTATGFDLHLLKAGPYTFTSTDGAGCIQTGSCTVTQPSILSATVTPTMVTCNSASDGIIAITSPTGGSGNYEYSINGGTSWQDNGSFNGLSPAIYNVQIRDAAHPSCLVALGVLTITQPAVLNAVGTVTTQSCSSCNDAAISLTVSGGSGPLTFTWTGPDGYSSASQNIASLKPGPYSVVIRDVNSCSTTVYFEVINPFVVTNTKDADEVGTLRHAINYANTHNAATPDLITFNIPIGLPATIQLGSALPDIIAPLVIDGYTQPGASLEYLTQRVEIEGTNAGAGSNGLTIKSSNCTVKGLIIDGFSGNGVQIASGTQNTITANSIYNNDALGIDLGTNGAVTANDTGDPDTGPNNLQNFPVLVSLSFSPGNVTVNGTLNSLRSALNYKLEFFANKVADNTGYGEGQTYLGSGSVTTNSEGNGTFTVTLPTMTKYGDVITATATDPSGNTSEFSQAIGGLQDQILSSTIIPFHYRVNGKGVKSISSAAVVNEVRSAFGNWTGISTSSMSFTYDYATNPPQYASASDNINVVTFTDDKFPFSPGILAVTAKTLKIGANDKVAQIIDADIVFNPYFVNNSTYDFGIADNPSYHGFFDIQSVTTHEIGHILGLLHSGVYNATMWFEVGSGTSDRSLEQDDKSWLSYRYPNNNYNQTFGSISGNIKYGYNNDPVAGAIVLAVDPATSLAVVHAYSDADGNYLIPGLPPGSYRVYIMPLDGDVYGRDLRPGNISAYIYSNTFYTDYPGEFYNNNDGAVEPGVTPTPVTVIAGKETGGIDFITNKDVSNPTVVSVVPANNASNVSVLPNILITFSEPVDMNSLTGNSCYLTLAGSSTKIGGKYQPNGIEDRSDVVLFTLPENALSYESEYTLHITTAVTDLKNNPLGTESTSIFHTGSHDAVLPTIKSTIPENNATNVFLTQRIMVSFSEPMLKSSVESSFALTTGNGTVKVDCSPSWDEYMTLTLTPKSPLIEEKTYSLIWTNAATDLSGNGLAASSINFSTIPVAPPTIAYMEPGTSLTTGVTVGTAIVVDFSEPINTATVNESTFKLVSGGSQVSGKFEFLNENSRVIFRPNADLTFDKTYTITLTGGIQDVSQVKMNFAGSTKTFNTAIKPIKPRIDYNDPASNTALTIEIGGNGFDPDPTKNKVTFSTLTSSGVNALATTASLTSLTVKVPYGAVSGGIRVTSNGVMDDQDPSNLTTYIFIGSYPDPCNTATGNTGTGSKPRDGALDFNGANAYITNSGENTVSVITNLKTDDPVNNPPVELLPRIQVGTTPMKIDINPTGTRAYVTNFDSHTVSVIDLTDVNGKKNQVISTIKVGVNPFGVVANGDRVYVANFGSNNITVINVDPNSGGFDHAVANVNTGTHNRDCDISTDGGTLVVTGDNGLTLVRITKTALGFDYAVSNSNPGSSTRDATITKDGGTAIVTTTDGGIFFVDITPGDNFGAAYGNTNPGAKAGDGKTTFDGLFYYVTNPDVDKVTVYKISYEGSGSGSGTVSSSSRISLKEYMTIPVGDSPEGIAMDPVNDKIVVVNSGSNNVTRAYICCPSEKTASDLIKDLVFDVQSMIYKGDIPKLRGYALVFTLNSSLRNINANRIKLAIADLKVFIGLVNTYIKNKQINADKGKALIAAANAIIAKLQGTKSDEAEIYSTDVVTQSDQVIITKTKLGVIYPNPTREGITINYEVAADELNGGKVSIQVYDISGRVIANLVNRNHEPGCYSVSWSGCYENGGPVPRGIYYIRFTAGSVKEVQQIMLVR